MYTALPQPFRRLRDSGPGPGGGLARHSGRLPGALLLSLGLLCTGTPFAAAQLRGAAGEAKPATGAIHGAAGEAGPAGVASLVLPLEQRFHFEAFGLSEQQAGGPAATRTWTPLLFARNQPMNHVHEECRQGRGILRLVSQNAGSGVLLLREFNPRRKPWLHWEWQVSGIAPAGDVRVRDKEDVPARLMILFPQRAEEASWGDRLTFRLLQAGGKWLPGEALPKAVLTYLWANRLPAGESLRSVFDDRVQLLALDSGAQHAGQWRRHSRNISQDFTHLFGRPVPQRAAIALASDSDDTDHAYTTRFAGLQLGTAPQAAAQPQASCTETPPSRQL